MILGVHHIAIGVRDVASLNWLSHIQTARDGCWITCPNVYFQIDHAAPLANPRATDRPVNLPGIAHICLQSRDIKEGLERGVEAGLRPISAPVDLGTPFRYLYAHTGDGILVELEGAPFARECNPRFWIGHVAFVAIDIVPLVDFYARLLNLTSSPVSRLRANALIDQVAGLDGVDLSAMWLPGLNLGLEFWQYHAPILQEQKVTSRTGFNSVCFQCNDFDGDCAHALENGAQPSASIQPELPNCRTATFHDPEGNCFKLIAFNNAADAMSIENLPQRDILVDIAGQLRSQ